MKTYLDAEGFLLGQVAQPTDSHKQRMVDAGAIERDDLPDVPDRMPYARLVNGAWESGDPDREAREANDRELSDSDTRMVRRMEDYFLRPEVFSTLDQEFQDQITTREETRVSRRALRQPARPIILNN